MAAPTVAYEIRYRVKDSGQPWTTARFPPDSTTITLKGLLRGEEYEGNARSVGPLGQVSLWQPVTWIMDTANEGATALPPVTVGNVGSRWVSGTAATWSADDTTADIAVTAGVLQVGDDQINYGASTAQISGTASEVRTVHLYYDDPQFAGGTRTLGVTTDKVASMSGHGRIYIATLTITFDTAGGGGTGGGGGIGGGGGGSGTIEP